MYVDSLLLLSDSQAVTADAVSTNTVDLGNVTPNRQVGQGEPLAVVVVVEVAADFTTGDETYVFEVLSDGDADLSSPTIIGEHAVAAGLLTAGSVHVFPIPPGKVADRYIGLQFDVGGTTPTITVSAFVAPMSQGLHQQETYANAYTITD